MLDSIGTTPLFSFSLLIISLLWVGGEELESWLTHRLNPRIDFEIIDEFDYEDKVMYVYSKWFKRMAGAMTLPSFFCLQLQRIFAHLPYIAYFCK